MRELKFRAWNKTESKMYYDEDIFYNGHNPKIKHPCKVTNKGILYIQTYDTSIPEVEDKSGNIGYNDWDQQRLYKDVDLMQFTGLSSNDGKDIWEGDILKFNGSTGNIPSGYCTPVFKKDQIFIVKVLSSGFTLSDPLRIKSNTPNQYGHVNNYDFWNHQRGMEIIGNIYENPEYLTNTN